MTDIIEARSAAPRMLIADDDPAILSVLADRCTKMGFQTDIATNGIQALIKARRNRPDILIIDVNMPELDGLSVCLRLLDPGNKPIELVVVTGSSDSETVERCESFGAFYGRKGPHFWTSIAAALTTIFPEMEDSIQLQEMRSTGAMVRTRPAVLVIDDDPTIEMFLSSRLGKFGVDLLYAADVTAGYRTACREKPSVIICDYLMPNGDAHYLLSKLRSTPATENVPVLILSGRQLDEHAEQILTREVCGRPGALRVFKKSFDTDELFETLQKFCGFEKKRT